MPSARQSTAEQRALRAFVAFFGWLAVSVAAVLATCATWLSHDLCETGCHGSWVVFLPLSVALGSAALTARALGRAAATTRAARELREGRQ